MTIPSIVLLVWLLLVVLMLLMLFGLTVQTYVVHRRFKKSSKDMDDVDGNVEAE